MENNQTGAITVRDQIYPDYFPPGCPPEDAKTDEQVLYRFCYGREPQQRDFVSYYLKNPQKYETNVLAYGLSVMKSREDCLRIYRGYPWARQYHSIAKGNTDKRKGSWKETPSRQNPNHLTWWVCKDVDPLLFFSMDTMIGAGP